SGTGESAGRGGRDGGRRDGGRRRGDLAPAAEAVEVGEISRRGGDGAAETLHGVVDGEREREALRAAEDERHHADDLAALVDDRTAAVAVVDGEIGLHVARAVHEAADVADDAAADGEA